MKYKVKTPDGEETFLGFLTLNKDGKATLWDADPSIDFNIVTTTKDMTTQTVINDLHPYTIGANYFIRTVTHHFTGKLLAVYTTELVLIDAAWIADDGRFSEAVSKGNFNEVEPYPDSVKVIIGRTSIIDACKIKSSLPRSQK